MTARAEAIRYVAGRIVSHYGTTDNLKRAILEILGSSSTPCCVMDVADMLEESPTQWRRFLGDIERYCRSIGL